MNDRAALAEAIDLALPQTQCTRCGFPDCRGYARAIAAGEAGINQCPPGGHQGIERLARISGCAVVALNPTHGTEGPRRLAVIDEAWCIGCTLCIKACPVDCIVGGPKMMHTVVEDLCTGCELCIPVCPVDCIALVDATPGRSGWNAWSVSRAETAREGYAFHRLRVERDQREHDERLAKKAAATLADLPNRTRRSDPQASDAKRSVIEAALARARSKRSI